MNFTQIISFNTATGGNIPGLCLDNVRRGFGIANKYSSAWEAWQHTEQHTDRNLPDGLDIPIYYSYTTTIDGVTENYGHINVRLRNGTVWSDGNIYASIDDYTSKKAPKFVGWGESVNDFKVIQEIEGEPMFSEGDANQLCPVLFGVQADDQDRALAGKTFHDAVYALALKYGDGNLLHFKQGILTPGDVANFRGTVGDSDASQDTAIANQGWHDGMYSWFAKEGSLLTPNSASKKLTEIKAIVDGN